MATSPFQSVLEDQKKSSTQQIAQSPTQPTPFRDDVNKQKELESKERIATTTALSKAMSDAAKATQQGFKEIASQPQGVQTPTQPAPAFQTFQDTLKQQAPQPVGTDALREATTAKIMGDLSEAPEGLSTGSEIQLSDLQKGLQEAERATKEQAIKSFGTGTGQVSDALRTQVQRGVLAEADLRGRLTAAEEQAQDARSAQAVGSALQLLGQEEQSRQFTEGLQFEETQAELDRTLATLSQDKQIAATENLQEIDQQFQLAFQERGFLNEKEIQNIDNAFNAQLQQAGFDQQTATLLTQLNHDKMMAANEQGFVSEQSELDRAWRTGERIDSEVFQKSVVGLEQAFAEKENALNRALELDVQENKFAFEDARLKAEQAYNDSVIDKNLSHEEAMAESSQVFQREMQNSGFSQEQVLQGQRLTQDLSIFEKELKSREDQFAIQMAQEDSQHLAQLGISQQQVDLAKSQIEEDMRQFDEQFGLQKEELTAALERQDVQDKLEAVAIAMEFMEDDEQALQPFVESMFGTLGKELGWTDEQIQDAISTTASQTTEGPEGTPTSFNFDDMTDKEFFDNLENPNFIKDAVKKDVIEPFDNASQWTTESVGDLKDVIDGESRGFITINGEVYRLHDSRQHGGFPRETTLRDTGKSYQTISLDPTDENGKPIEGQQFQIFLTGDKKGKVTKGGVDFVDVKDFGGF